MAEVGIVESAHATQMPSRLLRVGAVIAVLVITAATVSTSLVVRSDEADQAQRSERSLTRRASDALSAAVGRALAGLGGASGLVSIDGKVDPHEFAAYGHGLLAQSQIAALAFAPSVAFADRTAFEQEVGHPILATRADNSVGAAGTKDRYLPVEFVYPESPTALAVVGFDVASDATLGALAADATRSGEARITQPFDSPPLGGRIFLAGRPLYRLGAEPTDVASR